MKTFKGEVISTKMDKTATVLVERAVKHPVYKKRYTRVKKYHVHDPYGVSVGQVVEFVPSKPYSKLKKWIIVSIDGEEKRKKSNSRDTKDKANNKKAKTNTKKADNTAKKLSNAKDKKKGNKK